MFTIRSQPREKSAPRQEVQALVPNKPEDASASLLLG